MQGRASRIQHNCHFFTIARLWRSRKEEEENKSRNVLQTCLLILPKLIMLLVICRRQWQHVQNGARSTAILTGWVILICQGGVWQLWYDLLLCSFCVLVLPEVTGWRFQCNGQQPPLKWCPVPGGLWGNPLCPHVCVVCTVSAGHSDCKYCWYTFLFCFSKAHTYSQCCRS